MKGRDVKPDTIIYTASWWWRDCDPCGQVVATTIKGAERSALKAMRREARDAWETGNGPEYGTLRALWDEIAWSGVHPFELSSLVDSREIDDTIDDLNASGFAFVAR